MLVHRTNRVSRWINLPDVEVVVGLRSLEPGTRPCQVQMNGVAGRDLIINTVEEVLDVSLVMHDRELGSIEETSAVRAIDGDEIAPVLSAVREVKRSVTRSEGTIGSGERAGGCRDTLA